MRFNRFVTAAAIVAGAAAWAGAGSAPTTTCLSTNTTTGATGELDSHVPTITPDGLVAAFASSAPDLVPGDTNNRRDIFVVDLVTGARTRASVSTSGLQANGHSYLPSLSNTGRFIAFETSATNLGGVGSGGSGSKVYWRDQVSEDTVLVAGASFPIVASAPDISASGRYVAYARGNLPSYCYVRNMQSGDVVQADIAMNGQAPNGGSNRPRISGTGRYVVFESAATNLTTDAIEPGSDHIFVRDLEQGVTTLITRGADGLPAPGHSWNAVISADGRFVVYLSNSEALSPDNDNVERYNVFLHDRQTGETIRVNERWFGGQPLFEAANPRISRDGRYVTYDSRDGQIVPGDSSGHSDVFMYDRILKRTIPVSRSSTGQAPSGASEFAVASDGGTRVVFASDATSMHSPDQNEDFDVFLRAYPNGPFCAGDVNGDHAVDMADLMWVVDSFNTTRGGPGFNANADQNADDHVDFADLNIVLGAYNSAC